MVLVEDTAGKGIATHFPKKQKFHGLIAEYRQEFLANCKEKYEGLSEYLSENDIQDSDIVLRHIYLTHKQDPSAGMLSNSKPFTLMGELEFRYFQQLNLTIGASTRSEILCFLSVPMDELLPFCQGGSAVQSQSFDGFALPQTMSGFSPGITIVSFYADAEALLLRSYVFRRYGWQEPDLSYQRVLIRSKIREMRQFLVSDKGRVFVNNIIVALGSDTEILDGTNSSLDLKKLSKKTRVKVRLPLEHGTIGLIDGQHRVFAYHEGNDEAENKIKSLRKRQNLLVTGLIFPSNWNEQQRRRLEAELFLSINEKQTNVNRDLKLDLQATIDPKSALGLAKRIVGGLAKFPPLSGILQRNVMDTGQRIKTASLVRFVLSKYVEAPSAEDAEKFDDSAYVQATGKEISTFLAEIKALLDKKNKALWSPSTRTGSGVLNPTRIGGFIFLLKKLKEQGHESPSALVAGKMQGLHTFDFKAYSSSRWAALRDALFDKYFK